MIDMKKLYSLPLAMALVFGFSSCGSKAAESAAAEQLAQTEAAETASAAEAASESAELNGNAVKVLKKGETLPTSSGQLMVVDFNATWCGPCRRFEPNFKAVAEKYAGKAQFFSVDVDEHPALAAKYRVQGIPMILFIAPDGELSAVTGYYDQADFDSIVASQLK